MLKKLFILFISYFLLVDLILPVNSYLPKLSIIGESVISLWSDYGFIFGFFFTTIFIYAGIFIVSGLLYFFFIPVRKLAKLYNSQITSFCCFLICLLLIIWIKNLIILELIVVLLTFSALLFSALKCTLKNKVTENYLDSIPEFIKDRDRIEKEVVKQSALPLIFKNLSLYHSVIWIVVLITEYIHNSGGIGTVYREIIRFSDISGFFALSIILLVTFKVGDYLIENIKNRLIFWK